MYASFSILQKSESEPLLHFSNNLLGKTVGNSEIPINYMDQKSTTAFIIGVEKRTGLI
jgi:hypothetical protein